MSGGGSSVSTALLYH